MRATGKSRRVSSPSLILDISSTHVIVKAGHKHLVQRELTPRSAKPVVKWPGGKQWLAPAAPHLIPESWTGRYYEPFVGGAAFFFALEPERATLSDRNSELIATYRALRTDPEGVIRVLKAYPYDEDFFYKVRESRPRSQSIIAARLLYLNRTCWNGLYRVNKKGRFNTPFGLFVNPTICDSERIRSSSKVLRRAVLEEGDFDKVVRKARKGDLVYLDPPYITCHQHNGFLKYNAPLFSWADQQRLAEVAKHLSKRGVHVLLSNAAHTTVSRLYVGFHAYRVRRNSLIAVPAATRGITTELLMSSYPILDCPSEIV